jgi:hypothetical protein
LILAADLAADRSVERALWPLVIGPLSRPPPARSHSHAHARSPFRSTRGSSRLPLAVVDTAEHVVARPALG